MASSKGLRQIAEGHHECEILGRGPESEESALAWEQCEKNPGHEVFTSVKDFKNICLQHVHTDRHRDVLTAMVDLTVRLRTCWTSLERSDDDKLSDMRGSDENRIGTGFIRFVNGPSFNELCPCDNCEEKISTDYVLRFKVQTAQHVVYNTEEAKSTKVDLFYDDDMCHSDGRMQTVQGVEVEKSKPDIDFSYMLCVTHDEALGERIKAAWRCWWESRGNPLDLDCLDRLSSCNIGRYPALIVSHPHGQPKKITIGAVKDADKRFVKYTTATCRGSSGATVFWFHRHPRKRGFRLWFPLVHNGHYSEKSAQCKNQVNYGCIWM